MLRIKIDAPRRGGSNEYPQSMVCTKNKKNRHTHAYPSFAIYKWDSRGYLLHGHVFLMKPSIFLAFRYCTAEILQKDCTIQKLTYIITCPFVMHYNDVTQSKKINLTLFDEKVNVKNYRMT